MNDPEQLASMFKIFSDPTRLRLFQLLQQCGRQTEAASCCDGALCVNALAARLGVTQSAVSQHLRILRQAGLVRGERRGAFMHYVVDVQGWAKCKGVFLSAFEADTLEEQA
ncbi:MAG: metalloregulator ArsR/SmtB family transcription factor [Anaerolineales bacterium]